VAALIRFFRELGRKDVPLVGGKNASLGEMSRELASEGVKVPNGFAVTADAYRHVLDEANAWEPLRAILEPLDAADVADLASRAERARAVVLAAPLPAPLRGEILAAYHALREEYGDELSVAVRSSATAEDLPTASFAGQHESYLNVKGDEAVLEAVRRCYASLFLDRAIHYRIDQGFEHFKVALSVGVQKMVRSDLASSGVMFSLDTESGFEDVVLITGAYGLGENVVQGAVDTDEFYVFKPTFKQGYKSVLRRRLGDKAIKMIYAEGATNTSNVPTTETERGQFCLADDEVLVLAGYATAIADHYGMPMDMEWAKDGLDGQLYLVQARPETVISQRSGTVLETYALEGEGPVIVTGHAVGEKVATGWARFTAARCPSGSTAWN
jgi:pyruvate,water dikinase